LDFWLGCAVKWNTVEPSVKNQEHLQTESNAQLCPIRNTAGINKDWGSTHFHGFLRERRFNIQTVNRTDGFWHLNDERRVHQITWMESILREENAKEAHKEKRNWQP
jgi:hypothetical protein